MTENFVEKRQHPRVRSRLPVEYKNLRGAQPLATGTLIRDISEGGFRFTSDKFLSLANRLVININIPTSARQIKAIAKIAWIRKAEDEDSYDIGNQFLEMSRDDKEEVSKYIKTVLDLNIFT